MSGIPELYISVSDIKNYMSCRQQWAFSSGLRGNWAPKETNKNLFVGSGAHAALEVYYKTPVAERSNDVLLEAYQAWVSKAWNALPLDSFAADRLAGIAAETALMHEVLKGYHDWAIQTDKFTIDKPEDVEIIFNIPMPIFPGKHVYFTGKADALIKLDGKYFLLEHKTAAKLPDTKMLFLDFQCVAYQWASQNDERFVNRRPEGTCYNFLLKSATAVKDPSKAHLRVEIKRSDNSLYVFGSWFLAIVAEMLDPSLAIYPSPDWFKCGWCAFKTPCQMVASGFSPTPILKQDFMKREHYYPVLEEKE